MSGVELTEAERDALNRAVYEPEDAVSVDPEEYADVTAAVHAAAALIIAARVADAEARLAAVEAVMAGWDRMAADHASATVRVNVGKHADRLRAALSTTAPDAGQREAQTRAKVAPTPVLVCGNTCEHNHDSPNGPTGCCQYHGPYMYFCADCANARADREAPR